MGLVMIRCPNTLAVVRTDVEVEDEEALRTMAIDKVQVSCSSCRGAHTVTMQMAYIV
jgi:hypothetical protein